MVTWDAKEYPETIYGEIQGGRPLHFLRLLSCYPLLEYPPKYQGVASDVDGRVPHAQQPIASGSPPR